MENSNFAELCKSTSLENLQGYWNGELYTEEWRDVKEYEGLYQVSSFGRVKSLERYRVSARGKYFMPEKMLKLSMNGSGYLDIKLCRESKTKGFRIHQLVAIGFLNHKPCGLEKVVDHVNNNKLNNFFKNLQLISQRENTSKDRERISKYVGVIPHNNKWKAVIKHNRKSIHLGVFDTEEKASDYYQKALNSIKNGNDIEISSHKYTSKYPGVCFNKIKNKWSSYIKINKKQSFLGFFQTEEEALEEIVKVKKDIENGIEFKLVKKKGTSKYRGVGFDKRKNKWRSRITKDGKIIFSQFFITEEEAYQKLVEYKKENGIE